MFQIPVEKSGVGGLCEWGGVCSYRERNTEKEHFVSLWNLGFQRARS